MATVTEALLTAEQYGQLPDNGQRTELVRGHTSRHKVVRIQGLSLPFALEKLAVPRSAQ